jgi:SPP1 family predicted phage head-tail adaptor
MSLGARLKHRVMVQQRVIQRDEIGGAVPGPGSWQDVVSVRASVLDVSGREYMAAGATQNAAVTKITIRKRSGLEPAMRVLHEDVVYNVEAVLDQDNGTLLLMCSRGANNG